MEIMQIISLVLNAVLSVGFVVTLATIKSIKKKAAADANKAVEDTKKAELDNIQQAITIWRQTSEGITSQYENKFNVMTKELQSLKDEVKRLNSANNKIIKLLEKISKENFEEIVAKIKEEIK